MMSQFTQYIYSLNSNEAYIKIQPSIQPELSRGCWLREHVRRWNKTVLMLGQNRRRWTNIKPTLLQCVVFFEVGTLHVYRKVDGNKSARPLTLSSLSLPLSSSSTTSRELLSQFSTCSGWKWLEVGDKWKNILLFLKQIHEIFCSKTTRFQEIKPSDQWRELVQYDMFIMIEYYKLSAP